MSDLNSDAEKLVRAGRVVLRPSDADRKRVFQALLPRIGGLGLDATNGAGHASGPAKASLLKVSAAVLGLGIVGAGLFLVQRPEPPAAPQNLPVPVKQEAVRAVPIEPAPETRAPVAPPETTAKRSPVASRSADNLAQEVAILSRASAELRAGRPALALKALEEHQRAFPGGVLAQERAAARIQALCALGRMKEAESELARLARTSPRSPHEARARKACGFGATGKE